ARRCRRPGAAPAAPARRDRGPCGRRGRTPVPWGAGSGAARLGPSPACPPAAATGASAARLRSSSPCDPLHDAPVRLSGLAPLAMPTPPTARAAAASDIAHGLLVVLQTLRRAEPLRVQLRSDRAVVLLGQQLPDPLDCRLWRLRRPDADQWPIDCQGRVRA